jgi:hypothetical protein
MKGFKLEISKLWINGANRIFALGAMISAKA